MPLGLLPLVHHCHPMLDHTLSPPLQREPVSELVPSEWMCVCLLAPPQQGSLSSLPVSSSLAPGLSLSRKKHLEERRNKQELGKYWDLGRQQVRGFLMQLEATCLCNAGSSQGTCTITRDLAH